MELLSIYLCDGSIAPKGFLTINQIESLFDLGWFEDDRPSKKYLILNKRFAIEDKWYRAMIRLKITQNPHGEIGYEADNATPFLVASCFLSRITSTSDQVSFTFVDDQMWHSKDFSLPEQFISAGVPQTLINYLISDIKHLTSEEAKSPSFMYSRSLSAPVSKIIKSGLSKPLSTLNIFDTLQSEEGE